MSISLVLVDELIEAAENLHGGARGRPALLGGGQHVGSSLNRACVVMISSALQAFVGDVFYSCSIKAFGRNLAPQEVRAYRETWKNWGNPSPENIIGLFRRLGVHDVFTNLSWQRQRTAQLKDNLDQINQIRNRIAHGQRLTYNGAYFPLRLANVKRWRNIAETFGETFEDHALAKIR